MARRRLSGIAWPLAGVLAAGLGLGSLLSCADVRAVSTESGRLDQVRLGFGLDPSGKVSPGCAASAFALHDTIHLSMQIADAPAESVVSVAIRDVVTDRLAWSEERPVPPGVSYQTFEIGSELAVGRYRAESTLGGRASTARPFVVHAKREGVR